MGTHPLHFIWLPRGDGTWRAVEVPVEHMARVAELAKGPNGDQTVSLVEMPEPNRKSA